MAEEIVMPRLSDSMEEGTILKWMKSVGDDVAVGDELVEIETDKANMVYESDAAGSLIEITAQEGDTLPIGEVIARVGDAGEAEEAEEKSDDAGQSGPRDAAEAPAGASDSSPEPDHGSGASDSPSQVPADESNGSAETAGSSSPTQPTPDPAADGNGDGDGRVKASPIAKRMAKEKGVDLGGLQGSGPGGRIIKADVEKAEAAPQAASAAQASGARERPETAKGEVQVVELTKVQQTVARRMAESKATAPHFYLSANIDMTRCFEARAAIKAAAREDEPVPSFNDMVVKACALALREFPRANGAYRDGKLELYSRINIGVAVAAQDALVVPTIFDVDRKGLREIAAEARALAQKVRDGKISPPELSGGTFTVSNLGMYGISNFSAVINPPQAGILAVGEIAETPVVRDGAITTARIMGVTLACDHRILYGADGAQFLGRVRAVLEEPLGLAL